MTEIRRRTVPLQPAFQDKPVQPVKPAMPSATRMEQTKIIIPVQRGQEPAEEYRWQFSDGTWTSWAPVPRGGIITMPPDARGYERRPKGAGA